MSTTAGVFSETTLQNIRAMADDIMLDDRTKLNFMAQSEIMNVIPDVQTAKVGELSQKKNYTIEVEWINNCAVVAQDCTTCSVGGPELSTNTQTYTIDQCVEAPFTVKGIKLIDNDFEFQELVAKGLLSADKVISENISQAFLAWLVTNAGTNQFNVAGEIGTVAGNVTNIAAANFTANTAIGYIVKVLQYNRFTNPLTTSGNQLYNDWQNARFNGGAPAADVGDANRFGALRMLWDIWNFTQGGYNDRMLSISTGAIAFASKSYYGPAVEDYGKDGKKWSMMSRNVPGLVLEVHYNTTGGGR